MDLISELKRIKTVNKSFENVVFDLLFVTPLNEYEKAFLNGKTCITLGHKYMIILKNRPPDRIHPDWIHARHLSVYEGEQIINDWIKNWDILLDELKKPL